MINSKQNTNLSDHLFKDENFDPNQEVHQVEECQEGGIQNTKIDTFITGEHTMKAESAETQDNVVKGVEQPVRCSKMSYLEEGNEAVSLVMRQPLDQPATIICQNSILEFIINKDGESSQEEQVHAIHRKDIHKSQDLKDTNLSLSQDTPKLQCNNEEKGSKRKQQVKQNYSFNVYLEEENDKLNIESSSSKEELIPFKSQQSKYYIESAISRNCEENYGSHSKMLQNQKYNNTYEGNNRSFIRNQQLLDQSSLPVAQKFKLPNESFSQVINVDNSVAITCRINEPFTKPKESCLAYGMSPTKQKLITSQFDENKLRQNQYPKENSESNKEMQGKSSGPSVIQSSSKGRFTPESSPIANNISSMKKKFQACQNDLIQNLNEPIQQNKKLISYKFQTSGGSTVYSNFRINQNSLQKDQLKQFNLNVQQPNLKIYRPHNQSDNQGYMLQNNARKKLDYAEAESNPSPSPNMVIKQEHNDLRKNNIDNKKVINQLPSPTNNFSPFSLNRDNFRDNFKGNLMENIGKNVRLSPAFCDSQTGNVKSIHSSKQKQNIDHLQLNQSPLQLGRKRQQRNQRREFVDGSVQHILPNMLQIGKNGPVRGSDIIDLVRTPMKKSIYFEHNSISPDRKYKRNSFSKQKSKYRTNEKNPDYENVQDQFYSPNMIRQQPKILIKKYHQGSDSKKVSSANKSSGSRSSSSSSSEENENSSSNQDKTNTQIGSEQNPFEILLQNGMFVHTTSPVKMNPYSQFPFWGQQQSTLNSNMERFFQNGQGFNHGQPPQSYSLLKQMGLQFNTQMHPILAPLFQFGQSNMHIPGCQIQCTCGYFSKINKLSKQAFTDQSFHAQKQEQSKQIKTRKSQSGTPINVKQQDGKSSDNEINGASDESQRECNIPNSFYNPQVCMAPPFQGQDSDFLPNINMANPNSHWMQRANHQYNETSPPVFQASNNMESIHKVEIDLNAKPAETKNKQVKNTKAGVQLHKRPLNAQHGFQNKQLQRKEEQQENPEDVQDQQSKISKRNGQKKRLQKQESKRKNTQFENSISKISAESESKDQFNSGQDFRNVIDQAVTPKKNKQTINDLAPNKQFSFARQMVGNTATTMPQSTERKQIHGRNSTENNSNVEKDHLFATPQDKISQIQVQKFNTNFKSLKKSFKNVQPIETQISQYASGNIEVFPNQLSKTVHKQIRISNSKKPGFDSKEKNKDYIQEEEKKIKEKAMKIMEMTKTQKELFQIKQNQPTVVGCQGCKCQNSKCLKLYCDCLKNNAQCGPKCNCNQDSCKNKDDFQKERQEAIMVILTRNISAFDIKVDKNQHFKGCNCKKSKCQQNYCECYENNVLCIEGKCKCEDCENNKQPCPSHQEFQVKTKIPKPENVQSNSQKVETVNPKALPQFQIQSEQKLLNYGNILLTNQNADIDGTHQRQKVESNDQKSFQQREFNPSEGANLELNSMKDESIVNEPQDDSVSGISLNQSVEAQMEETNNIYDDAIDMKFKESSEKLQETQLLAMKEEPMTELQYENENSDDEMKRSQIDQFDDVPSEHYEQDQVMVEPQEMLIKVKLTDINEEEQQNLTIGLIPQTSVQSNLKDVRKKKSTSKVKAQISQIEIIDLKKNIKREVSAQASVKKLEDVIQLIPVCVQIVQLQADNLLTEAQNSITQKPKQKQPIIAVQAPSISTAPVVTPNTDAKMQTRSRTKRITQANSKYS